MNLYAMFKLPLTPNEGWPDLIHTQLGVKKILLATFVPFALLPPVMLYFTATDHPEMLPHAVDHQFLGEMAVAFFFVEIATSLAMGWFIGQVGKMYRLTMDRLDAFLVSSIAPVPMWLSSLGLLIPHWEVSLIMAFGGLGLTCAITYNGILAICRTDDELVVASIVQTVMGICLAVWACLLALVII